MAKAEKGLGPIVTICIFLFHKEELALMLRGVEVSFGWHGEDSTEKFTKKKKKRLL